MTTRGVIVGALLSAMTWGCDAEQDDLGPSEFRTAATAEGAWWEPDLAYPGDGAIEVRGGDDDDDYDGTPDTILWDIDDAGIMQRTDDGTLADRLVVSGTSIASTDASGQTESVRCTVVAGDHSSGADYRLVDTDGEVIFSMWNRFVFSGDGKPGEQADPVVSFQGHGIHLGPWWGSDPVAVANESIDRASPVRRLLLAALVTGECGGRGLQ